MIIGPDAAPALGDVRALKRGDRVYLREGASGRADWGRYADALAQAIGRGVAVLWLEGGKS